MKRYRGMITFDVSSFNEERVSFQSEPHGGDCTVQRVSDGQSLGTTDRVQPSIHFDCVDSVGWR